MAAYGEALAAITHVAVLLDGIKGRFILILNDTPGVRETFADFRIDPDQNAL